MTTFVDLFCGGGFGARGAVQGGGVPLLGIDAWELATKTYKANFPGSEIITDLIQEVNLKEIKNNYQPDVLLTSPECTAHSIANGAKQGSEQSRETAMGIVPWIEALLPRWVIVENVNRMKKWSRHDELVQTIESLGYVVNDLLLNSAEFGAAQARKRMFLVCDLNGEKISKDDLLQLVSTSQKYAEDIINWKANYRSSPLTKPGRAEATLARAERAIDTLGEGVPFLIVYYGSDYAGGWQKLTAPLRTVTTVDRFGLVTWEKGTPYLRMLQPDELILAMGGGASHKLPYGTRRDRVKLCGNGVCSDVMTAIFRWIELKNGICN